MQATTSSWVPAASGSLYDIDNLPYGVFQAEQEPARVGVRIGDQILDLAAAAARLRPEWSPFFAADKLNPLMAAGPAIWADVRAWTIGLLSDPVHADQLSLVPVAGVSMQLPFEVADYVDYYASEQHATNVGRMFRPDSPPLLPNWKHLPVGYHGRAGSIVVSGTDIHRPSGQRKAKTETVPSFGPCRQLDVETELGFVIGRSLPLGVRVPVSEFDRTVFGVTGVNDWSARDIQSWEYVPLGPNLAKSFATSISAWITPLAALESARVERPAQDPEVLGYLREQPWSYDIEAEVEVNGTVLLHPPYPTMYWSPAQMLAHLTVNGASLRVGDFYASGTISGPEPEQWGSFLELSWAGSRPWIANGQERTFLLDGDEVVLRYTARGAHGRIGLGEVRATILPTT